MNSVRCVAVFALLSTQLALAAQKPALLGQVVETSLGSRHTTLNRGLQGDSVPVLLTLSKCFISGPQAFSCDFSFQLNTDKDSKLGLQRSEFFIVFANGATASASAVTISNTIEIPKGDERELAVFPRVTYPVTATFEGTGFTVKDIKYLDVGWKDDRYKASTWVRYETVVPPPLREPIASLPTPQPSASPSSSLTTEAADGYGSIAGVSLNGGLYDITLHRCRPIGNGTANCTLTLTPMRVTVQEVTLENLNVTASGATVPAMATVTPTVMTLTVTAPINVNRIDELRLGNARFLNVGVK